MNPHSVSCQPNRQKSILLSLLLLWLAIPTALQAEVVTDVITAAFFHSTYSEKKLHGPAVSTASGAEYYSYSLLTETEVGNYICFSYATKAVEKTGIYTSRSGGRLKSITIRFAANPPTTLVVYGSHSAYPSMQSAYVAGTRGDKLGVFDKQTTTLEVEGDYTHFAIVYGGSQQAGLVMVESITVEWQTAVATLAPPLFSLESGTYATSRSLTLTPPVDGASIYYTLNEAVNLADAPTEGTLYSEPIVLASETTVSAVSYLDGVASEIATRTYRFGVVAPTLSVADNTVFTAPLRVYAHSPQPEAAIYYTTDGTTPSPASTPFPAEGLLLTATTTLKVVAATADFLSDVVTAKFIHLSEGRYAYTQVLADEDVVDGGHYLLVGVGLQGEAYALSSIDQSGNFFTGAPVAVVGQSVSVSADSLNASEGPNEIRILHEGTKINLLHVPENAYLFDPRTSPSGGNYLRLESLALQAGAKWEYDFPTDSEARSFRLHHPYYKSNLSYMGYNVYSDRFSTYSSEANLSLHLFRRVDATVSSLCYATLYSPHAFVMPDGLRGGILRARREGEEALTPLVIEYRYPSGSIVPASTPLLLNGTPRQYTFAAAQTDDLPPADNLLVGTAVGAMADELCPDAFSFYQLADEHCEAAVRPSFQYGATAGGPFHCVPGHCVLALDANLAAAVGEEFSVNELTALGIAVPRISSPADGGVYDLLGRRLPASASSQLPSGVYLIGGRKLMVR